MKEKIVKAIVLILSYFAILGVVYVVDVKFLPVDVVFYDSLYCALVSVAILGVLIFKVRYFSAFNNFEKLQHIVVCALLGYAFAITIPTIIDRSLSFYILEKLQQRGGGIQLAKFSYIFSNEYVREAKLVDIRLTEQVASGTITIDGGCVRLTPWGAHLADFGNFFREHLLPKKRLLRGVYTDQLLDPFSRSDAHPDYLCH